MPEHPGQVGSKIDRLLMPMAGGTIDSDKIHEDLDVLLLCAGELFHGDNLDETGQTGYDGGQEMAFSHQRTVGFRPDGV